MSTYLPQCLNCTHLQADIQPVRPALYACAAFPQGIPTPIMENHVDHRLPYAGDHGIHFTPASALTHPLGPTPIRGHP